MIENLQGLVILLAVFFVVRAVYRFVRDAWREPDPEVPTVWWHHAVAIAATLAVVFLVIPFVQWLQGRG